jgi:hypothetical protein
MLKLLILTVLLSLLCHKCCVGRSINTVGTPQELGRQSSLPVDPGTPRPHNEEVKKIRRTKRSVFIAPAFSTTSHLPGCAEGYRQDSMGRCVKLVKLNHTAQLDFLLHRLNTLYATPVIRRGYEDHSASDSSTTRPLHVSTPINIPPEPDGVPKESVEVAEEMENSGDLGMESDSVHHEEGDLKLSASSATKYKIINKSKMSSVPKASLSEVDEKQLLSTTPISVLLSEDSGRSLRESIKATDAAVKLSVEVGNMSTEDGRSERSEKRSRRDESASEKARKEATTESVTIIIEPFVVNVAGAKYNRNRDFLLEKVLFLLVIIWRYKTEFSLMK